MPPLELTSKPVDPSELKGLNGLYGGNQRRAGFVSLLVHAGIIALLLYIGSLKTVQKAVKEMATLIILLLRCRRSRWRARAAVAGHDGDRDEGRSPKPVRTFVPPTEHFQTQLPAPVSVNADLPDIDSAIGTRRLD